MLVATTTWLSFESLVNPYLFFKHDTQKKLFPPCMYRTAVNRLALQKISLNRRVRSSHNSLFAFCLYFLLLCVFLHRWHTGCCYAESGHSLWRISTAPHHAPPPWPPLILLPFILSQVECPSSAHHELGPSIPPPAGKSPLTFRTTRTSQRGSSTVSCPY